ncbi:kinetochore protein NUF2 [Ceratobasidium sp. AG-Ba]|nr:kinetochore protein NUF2 [Ceratobasidium sp. AG-Ba]
MSGEQYEQGNNFSFVILSPADISEWIASYDVSISVEELSKPTPQTVEIVYTLLLELYKNITVDDQENTKLKMLDHQENQELYGDIFFLHILYHHITRMAALANAPLTFQDLVRPEPKRTIRIISGLINLVKFRQSQMPDVVDLQNANQESFERRDRAAWERAQAEGKLKDYKKERAVEQPEVDQLREQIAAIKNELPGLQKTYQKVTESRTGLKKEQLALVQRVQKLNDMIIAKSERNEDLRARLVEDPELLQKNIRDLSDSLANARQALAAEETKARDLKTRIDWLGSVETDVALSVEASKIVEAERAKWQEAQQALNKIELELNKRVIEHREMNTKRDHLFRQLEHTQEKYSRAQRHGEESRQQAEQTVYQLREALEVGIKERSETSDKAEEVRRMVADVEAQIIEYVAREERQLNEMIVTYSTLRDRTDQFIETLTKKLNLKVTGQ